MSLGDRAQSSALARTTWRAPRGSTCDHYISGSCAHLIERRALMRTGQSLSDVVSSNRAFFRSPRKADVNVQVGSFATGRASSKSEQCPFCR